MRAGGWLIYRDINAARISLQHARQVADLLPADDPDQLSMRIAPRTLLCGTTWRVGGDVADTGFDELRHLCALTGDRVSLAIGMSGLLTVLFFHGAYDELPPLTTEYVELVETSGDPTLPVALLFGALNVKFEDTSEAAEGERSAQRVIELADGDPTVGNLLIGSPLAFAHTAWGIYRTYLGHAGWKADLDEDIRIARDVDPNTFVYAVFFKYVLIGHGALQADAVAMRDTAEALEVAEQFGDDLMLGMAGLTRGIVLINRPGPDKLMGEEFLRRARETATQGRYFIRAVDIADVVLAQRKARDGELDSAITVAQATCDKLYDEKTLLWAGSATAAMVEALLQRGARADFTTRSTRGRRPRTPAACSPLTPMA